MNRIQKSLSSAAIVALFAVMPLAASADTLHASSTTGVVISSNGIVHVIGAQVTSVSNGVVNAVTTVGSVVMNWVVNVSASTKLAANGSMNATTTDIKVGDKVNFAGALSSSVGSTLSVAGTKIRDITNFPHRFFGAHATSTGSVKSSAKIDSDIDHSGKSKGIHAGLNFLGGLHIGLGKGH